MRDSERERLYYLFQESKCPMHFLDNKEILDTTDYLLANGVVVPPVKVGDIVYAITSDSPTGIEETRVSQIKIKVKENGKISYRISAPCVYDDWGEAHWTFCEFDFGKTVFFTREEAEQKLKEMSK